MKKLLVLKVSEKDMRNGKKMARTIKKQFEKLWGKDSCEVAVIPMDSVLETCTEVRDVKTNPWGYLTHNGPLNMPPGGGTV